MGATSEDMTVGVTPVAGGQIRELSSEGAPSSRPLGHAAWGARVLAPGTAWLLEGKEPPLLLRCSQQPFLCDFGTSCQDAP